VERKNSLGGAPLEGVRRKRRTSDKFHQCDCAETLCAQDLSSGVQTLGDGTCIASLAGSKAKRAELLTRVFQDKFHQCYCAEKLCAQDLPIGVQTLGMHSFVGREQG